MILYRFQIPPPPFQATQPAQLSHLISGLLPRYTACASSMRVCHSQKPQTPVVSPSAPSADGKPTTVRRSPCSSSCGCYPVSSKIPQRTTHKILKRMPNCQNSASGADQLSRQACRHLPILTPFATHGCAPPSLGMDEPALNPAPLMSPDVPLASLASVEFVASRPNSDLSFSVDAQKVNHHVR